MGEIDDVKLAFKREKDVEQIILRIRSKMRPWGITITFLAMQLGVSRQYAWQIVYYRTMISVSKALEVERTIDEAIAHQKHMKTFGDKLRAARISAGLTLKQVAEQIGYTWIAVERWEQNRCLPKPGVLWHLRSVYGAGEDWLPVQFPSQLKQSA
jgi:DNA-binding transcriptional regulator YiaG